MVSEELVARVPKALLLGDTVVTDTRQELDTALFSRAFQEKAGRNSRKRRGTLEHAALGLGSRVGSQGCLS